MVVSETSIRPKAKGPDTKQSPRYQEQVIDVVGAFLGYHAPGCPLRQERNTSAHKLRAACCHEVDRVSDALAEARAKAQTRQGLCDWTRTASRLSTVVRWRGLVIRRLLPPLVKA